MVTTRLYERETFSLGQAAELAGRSKREFAELLGSFGVSIFNYPASWLHFPESRRIVEDHGESVKY